MAATYFGCEEEEEPSRPVRAYRLLLLWLREVTHSIELADGAVRGDRGHRGELAALVSPMVGEDGQMKRFRLKAEAVTRG
eukprot:5409599-Prymnesium_polylepis.1